MPVITRNTMMPQSLPISLGILSPNPRSPVPVSMLASHVPIQ
jgi:hypothetical protein